MGKWLAKLRSCPDVTASQGSKGSKVTAAAAVRSFDPFATFSRYGLSTLHESWQERAAIMECDGGLDIAAANRAALDCVFPDRPGWVAAAPSAESRNIVDEAWRRWWEALSEASRTRQGACN